MSSVVGVTLKKVLKPRSVSVGASDDPVTNGMPYFSATWLAGAATALWNAPWRRCTFSWVIIRSAIAWARSGRPPWSSMIRRILMPPFFGRPSPLAKGSGMSKSPFTMS